ncbi:exonuclease subunit SbcD [Alteromonas gilva]|uniref:Nuclease SbcCD subunit D n=1 Tax=Alteromonas gilva TaxID=2987522 RepID=A0ABT5L4F3_9ALTE|nr:exonuclease subunit SbcD [Alteromonas gilva]MDC8831914.1 exonuclease subunit SbcD [Alteromonas gilva]
MKILHTSDWHLGQSFFTQSRKYEHQCFIQWLLALVEKERIDAVIIAGDVFDTGTPPSYAREMYNQFVVDMQALGCALVVLGGNHDSVSMLNESRQLLAQLNTTVVASTGLNQDEQVFALRDRSGKVGAILCAVPYIRPRDVLQSQAGDSGTEKRQALGEAIKQHYASLYALAVAKRDAAGGNLPIIATGHLTALGVSQSDSVRDIYIGTLEGFAADGFPPADYIALGHIHRPQKVAKSEHIRYSGSPIPLSFDELSTAKQVVLVTFANGRVESVTPTEVSRFQPLATIRGDLGDIERGIAALNAAQYERPVWLCLEVDTQDYLSDLQQRVQAITEGLNVEVLQLRRVRNKQRQLLSQQQKETLAELSPTEVFEKRLSMESFDTDEDKARAQRITERFAGILSDVLHQEGEA